MAEESKSAETKAAPGTMGGPAAKDETVSVSDIEKLPAVEKHDEDAIEAWFKDHFVGTALGASTELYNLGYVAKEDLKKRLAR